MRKIRVMFPIFLFAILVPRLAISEESQISGLFEYSGYSRKEYGGYTKTSTFVEMSDGVKLAVDVYLPGKGPNRQSFPAVVEFTPYSRAFINPALKPLEKNRAKNMFGGFGAEIPNPFCFNELLLKYGYALVIADVRGSGASFGSRFDLMPRIGDDGAELVDWVSGQQWCDGSVGMKGGSYMAITSIMTAARKPKALKAIFIMVYPFGYHDLYAGGIYNQGFMTSYSELLWAMNMNLSRQSGIFPIMPSAPAVDEDGDGELLDEIPIDKNGDGNFVNDYNYPLDPDDPPQYADKKPRGHIYYLATREHEKNAYMHDWISKAEFIDVTTTQLGLDQKFGNINGYGISPISLVPEIMKSGIPIYHVGGWMDAQTRSAALFFDTARKTNPSKLLMIPGYHVLMSPFYKYFGESQDRVLKGLSLENVRFFDRYLKGIENGIDTEPPVMLYVMGTGWRQENEWPPARLVNTDYFFAGDNKLSTQPSGPGKDIYKADFTQDSRFGAQKANRWVMFPSPDVIPDRADLDPKCLTYTTEPLAADMEVTGHPIVDFWISSTADNGDFFVYLEDITPQGQAILVTENPLRAGFAALYNNDNMILGGITGVDVLPDLPWHGYEKSEYVDGIFAGGKIVNLRFDLQPTSWVFKQGHRVRVSIAAADWPTFRLDPKLAPHNKPDDPKNIIPSITFYRDTEHPSRITLPVIP